MIKGSRVNLLFGLSLIIILSECIFPAEIIKDRTILPGFKKSPYFDEQVLSFSMEPNINVEINAPGNESFDPHKKVLLIFYAAPNFNTIDQTIGKQMQNGDDWHFNIQHIGAQTRFLRNMIKSENIIVAYVATGEESWPWWKTRHTNPDSIIASVVDSVRNIFNNYKVEIALSGHSGGGSFVLGYINAVKKIPNSVKRISFIDSDYDYDNSLHGGKIINWLKQSNDHFLSVLAYDDRDVKFDGKNVVTPTGGTFYKSTLLEEKLSTAFYFRDESDSLFIKYTALNGRIKFFLKTNPDNLMWHTVQVEDNGFIQSIVSGTKYEGEGYTYWGPRAYARYIQP
ncbi:MAG: hypothetical protein ACYCVH_07400 [Ignavibacteriaceae bacterium]